MLSNKNKELYRNRFSCLLSFLYRHIPWHTFAPVRGIFSILFLSGCCPDVLPEADSLYRAHASFVSAYSNPSSGSTLDIFAFENDRLRRLDSYQRIDDFSEDTAYAESTAGSKIFFFCISAGKSVYEWADMNSYSSLSKVRIDLEDETRECLTRTGECMIADGEDGKEVILKPLAAQVDIDRISCDFSGTPYSGQKLTSVRAYLTNVNGTCSLLGSASRGPERLINQGMLRENELKTFREPDLVFAELAENLGTATLQPDINFICFPNSGSDNLGSPCTRLVIEGKIDGNTYYWPINVKGIERNCRYVFDIVIRRKGTSDPDTPIDLEECTIQYEIKPWKEKKEYGVRF